MNMHILKNSDITVGHIVCGATFVVQFVRKYLRVENRVWRSNRVETIQNCVRVPCDKTEKASCEYDFGACVNRKTLPERRYQQVFSFQITNEQEPKENLSRVHRGERERAVTWRNTICKQKV
jgi:hypothetical protein